MKKIFLLIFVIFFAITPTFSKEKGKTAVQNPIPSSGYVGTLPDVTAGFQKSQPAETAPMFDSVDSFDKVNAIKPTPTDNPAFINIIQKKDKTSAYVNDLMDFISILNQLDSLIATKSDTQHFNAAANYLNENVNYLKDKYQNKSESSYYSFKRLLQLNSQVQTMATVRSEKEIYKPYLATGSNGYLYESSTINQQLNYLQKNIEKTILIIKETR